MLELKRNHLVFTFPDIHPEAELKITFERTLRIPDDGTTYSLPPGFGSFPLKHVDDFAENVPEEWIQHGGVMLPMYQSEALWINFESKELDRHDAEYPFAVKIATGKVDALTGGGLRNGLHSDIQDYLVVPEQPWLDGYSIEKGLIRQFVAMPLGSGYSAEEQITGHAEHGGLQIIVYPMKRSIFERRYPEQDFQNLRPDIRYSADFAVCEAAPDMGFAPGGRMKQEVYEDPYEINDWEINTKSRCFVHVANSLVWRSITGDDPPTVPLTSKEYTQAGLPWFDYYNDPAKPLTGSDTLKTLKSISTIGKEKNENPLPENQSVSVTNIIELRKNLHKDEVREGDF